MGLKAFQSLYKGVYMHLARALSSWMLWICLMFLEDYEDEQWYSQTILEATKRMCLPCRIVQPFLPSVLPSMLSFLYL